MLNVQHTDAYTDFTSLAKLKTEAKSKSPEAIKEVAKQFESIFLSRVLKTMRQAKLSDGILDSDQSQFYSDMYDQQLALHLSGDSGTGLAEMIAKQLSPEKDNHEGNLAIEDYLNRAERTASNVSTVFNKEKLNQIEIGVKSSNNRIESKPIATKPIESREQFIQQLLPYAEKAAEELGVDAKVLLAQAALETAWGKSVISNKQGQSSFNLFNIKADKSWQGKQVNKATLEFDGGVVKKEMAGFRSYPSFAESFHDYVDFIQTNPRYGKALKNVAKPEHYMHELQQAGYATDPDYANKVMQIYQSKLFSNLDQTLLMANAG